MIALSLLLCLPGLLPAAPAAEQTVLVAGASGRTGSYIITALRDASYQVRPLTRNAQRASERFGKNWDWTEVDVRDPASVAGAMQGVDFMICSIGASQRSGENGPEFVDYGGVRNLVDASKAAGVKHFVLISSAAAGPYRKRSGMVQLGDIRYWKTRGEDHLKQSGLGYTIIGPGGLLSEAASGLGLELLSRREYSGGQVAMGDVAMLAVNALTNPAAGNKSFAIIRNSKKSPDAWQQQLADLPLDQDSDEAAPTIDGPP